MENESVLKQQEKERRELEEVQRREARMRELEEDERKMAQSAGAKTPRGGRWQARATSRAGVAGRVSSQASLTAPSKQAGVTRAGSVSGRGPSSQRGRSRGT